MEFINPPEKSPQNVFHKTFYSQLLNHEIGYNIYLTPGYEDDGKTYPVAYHLHGWTGNESSEILPMKKVYRNKQAITVFRNSSPVIEDFKAVEGYVNTKYAVKYWDHTDPVRLYEKFEFVEAGKQGEKVVMRKELR